MKKGFSLAVFAPFLEEHHKEQIETTAARYGVKVLYDPEDISGVEAIFGTCPNPRLATAKKLKWFAGSWAGVDAVLNGEPRLRDDVLISCSSGCYGITISEHIIMTILMLFRREVETFRSTEEREWIPLFPMRTIYGSTATIVGVGDIGRCTARRLRALGVTRIRGVRRSVSGPDEDFDEMYQTKDLIRACEDTDLLILCAPGTSETKAMISKEVLDSLSPKTVLINIGRGNAIDQDALCDALNEGRIAGAALDVTVPEPLPIDHPLWSAKNILITPHIAGRTAAPITRDLIVDKFCRNLVAYCEETPLESVVDRAKGY